MRESWYFALPSRLYCRVCISLCGFQMELTGAKSQRIAGAPQASFHSPHFIWQRRYTNGHTSTTKDFGIRGRCSYSLGSCHGDRWDVYLRSRAGKTPPYYLSTLIYSIYFWAAHLPIIGLYFCCLIGIVNFHTSLDLENDRCVCGLGLASVQLGRSGQPTPPQTIVRRRPTTSLFSLPT